MKKIIRYRKTTTDKSNLFDEELDDESILEASSNLSENRHIGGRIDTN